MVTPTKPVDETTGEDMPHDGTDFPMVPGNSGDKVTLNPSDMPGYDKPTVPIDVMIPETGGVIKVSYVKTEENVLPNTGDENKISMSIIGTLLIALGFAGHGIYCKRNRD